MQGSIDFTGLLSGDIIGEGGTTVIANPSGSATDTLNKVQIDETIYDVEGGGGTEVIANPSGSATDTLNKVQIDETIYAIEGSEQIQSDWTQTDTSAVDYIKHKPILSTVATSGSYDDLFNKPTIPTVIANPSGTPTETLTSVNIDGSIYNIPSGGGSSITLTKLTKAQYDVLTPAQQTDPSIIYFIDDPVPVLDPDYTYHKALNDQIVVRVYHEGEGDQHIVWFFNGFEKTSSDANVPDSLMSYVPSLDTSVTAQAMSPTSSEASYDYWIGWSRSLGTGVIRSWNSSWGSTVGGTFWAVVDNDGGDEQTNEYTTPYVYITGHSDNYIYYQGIRYDDTTAENVSYNNTVSGLTSTNVQGAVDELKSNLTQLNGLTVYRNLTPQTSYASFNDGSNLPLISLTTNIEPVQAGSGDPSPSNIRPISGFTEANIVVSPTDDTEDGTTYTVEFRDGSNPLTVYGGSLDVVSGTLVVDKVSVNLGSLSWTNKGSGYFISNDIGSKNIDNRVKADAICSNYTVVTAYDLSSVYPALAVGWNNMAVVDIRDTDYTNYTGEQFKTAINGVQLVYELATPQTYHLTPTQVNSLLGQNYIFSDTGNITNVKYIGVLNFS